MSYDHLVNKYVDITYSDGDGASGWVAKVENIGLVDHLIFDYGMGFPILDGCKVTEVTPPANDPEMMK